jgi:signal recognition particle subunit SRP54
MMEAKFDFNDFIKQIRMIKNMGSFGDLLKMIPLTVKVFDEQLKKGEDEFKKIEVMIGSMTKAERATPELLATTPSRRRRIAKGCGRTETEVNKMVADFTWMRSMMQ